jgi:hypothetical protein
MASFVERLDQYGGENNFILRQKNSFPENQLAVHVELAARLPSSDWLLVEATL